MKGPAWFLLLAVSPVWGGVVSFADKGGAESLRVTTTQAGPLVLSLA